MAAPEITTPLPRPPASSETEPRLRRLRWVAWLLDRSIPIGGKWRIGLDPLLGLIPGAGDWLGAVLSLYLLYEAARLGVPVRVLVRMGGNILVETIVGAVPVLGDLFDFVWQANIRNLQLIEQHTHTALRARPLRHIGVAFAIFTFVVLGLTGLLAFVLVRGVVALFNQG
jgi:hypothetical protein